MRPVDKGAAPQKEYKQYKDAEPDLEERIGAYCSFCEMSINHVAEKNSRGIIYYFPANTVTQEKERMLAKVIKINTSGRTKTTHFMPIYMTKIYRD